ncbi:MAG: hypothetical protein ACOC04_04155 [Halothece sp.]
MPFINLTSKLKSKILWLSLIYLPLFGLLAAIKIQNKIAVSVLFTDIFVLANVPVYTGLISNFGIFLWAATGIICFFTYVLLLNQNNPQRKVNQFIFYGGVLSFLLMVDDGFLLHERIFPNYLQLPQEITVAVYGIFVILFLLKFRKIVVNSDFTFLSLAILFFGCSILVDFLVPENYKGSLSLLIEDGNKLLGIASWATYFISFSFKRVENELMRTIDLEKGE